MEQEGGGLQWECLLAHEPTMAEASDDENALAASFQGARLKAGDLCRLGLSVSRSLSLASSRLGLSLAYSLSLAICMLGPSLTLSLSLASCRLGLSRSLTLSR